MNSDKKKIENIVRNRARSTSGRELMNFEHKEDAIEAETIAEDIEIKWKTSLLRNDENRSKNCKIFPLIFRFYV